MLTMNKQSAAELLDIINHSEDEIKNKIPKKFIEFLKANADENYSQNIDFTSSEWKETISNETRILLAIIYRDFIASKERIKELDAEKEARGNKEERIINNNVESSLNSNNEANQNNGNSGNVKIIKVEEGSWLTRLLKKISTIFVKK